MNRRTFLKNTVLTTAGLLCAPSAFPLSAAPGRIPVQTLEGPPRKRGRIHGESLRARIHELAARWKKELIGPMSPDPDAYIKEFVSGTSFTRAISRWTPDLEEEVKGISEGSGIEYETLLAFQFVDEEWWYRRNKHHGIGLPEGEKCSVIAAFDNPPPLLAQNLDLFTYADGFQTLLHVKEHDSDLESFVLTYPGFVGMNGLNTSAVGVCVNALLQLDQCLDGLPVAFVVRGILAQDGYRQALEFVREIRHASGQCYTIGGPKEIAAIECSAHEKARFEPPSLAGRVCHTNHPLASKDQKIYGEILKRLSQEGAERRGKGNSEIRFSALERRLKEKERVTKETLKAALGSHDDPHNPVCRHRPKQGEGGFTFACTVMELSDSPTLYMAPGPACMTAFESFVF